MNAEIGNVAQNDNAQKVFDDTFGNYMLHGIDEVFLPQVVSWWPTTIAWKILAAMFVIYIFWFSYQTARKWRRNRYRRLALEKVDDLQAGSRKNTDVLSQLPSILKATALHAYQREEVASLTGKEWLKLLDSKCKSSTFNSLLGNRMLAITYQRPEEWDLEHEQLKQIFTMARTWIKHHIPEDRKSSHG